MGGAAANCGLQGGVARENGAQLHFREPRPLDREVELASLATRQHRAVGDDQLVGLGFSRDAIRYRVKCRRFQRIHPGVCVIGPGRLDQIGRWWAALLATRPSPALSHLSSAAYSGLAKERDGVHVTIPRRSARKLDGVIVHGARRLDPIDLTRTEDGLPITTLPRTLLDLAEILAFDRLESIFEEVDRRNRLDLRALRNCMGRNPGRRGLKPLGRLLDEYLAVGSANPGLERRFQRFLDREGFPQPLTNVLVEGLLVDCWWPEHRLAVELDSRDFHRHWKQQERDLARDSVLMRAGIPRLRVTHRRMTSQRHELIADLAAHLPRSRRSAALR